jgi:hypothetical protein|tara:strand:- start:634 stop:1023 length:390 start_codon:yes stop_codon:yes gene_type:complete
MNLKNIFKNLILIDLLLIVLIIVASFFESERVITFNENSNLLLSEMFFIILAFIIIVAYFICLYFLYKFKPIGKQLYLVLFIGVIIVSLFAGEIASTSIEYILDGLGWANSGAILALLYFSPIKKEFEK